MKTIIILVMHGAPPNDFPRRELGEFFSMQMRLEHAHGTPNAELEGRYAELEAKMRAWPRTAQNDPFYAGASDMAEQLGRVTGREVILGFNEFCAPSLDEAFDQAATRAADRIVVVTPMMTRGGEHSEKDIPEALEHAKEKYPQIEITYVWPFDVAEVARFLARQIEHFVS